MLKDEDRIFKNLYNDMGSDIISAQNRGDWVNTKEITVVIFCFFIKFILVFDKIRI